MIGNADKGTKLRLVAHICACLIVAIIAFFDIAPVIRAFSGLVAIIVFTNGFWFNNSFTDEAILGDVLKEATKSDNIEFEIDDEIVEVEGEE